MTVLPGDIVSFDPDYLEQLEGHGIDVDDAQEHLMIVITVDVRVPNPVELDTSHFTIRGNEYVLGSGGLFWDSGLFKR